QRTPLAAGGRLRRFTCPVVLLIASAVLRALGSRKDRERRDGGARLDGSRRTRTNSGLRHEAPRRGRPGPARPAGLRVRFAGGAAPVTTAAQQSGFRPCAPPWAAPGKGGCGQATTGGSGHHAAG